MFYSLFSIFKLPFSFIIFKEASCVNTESNLSNGHNEEELDVREGGNNSTEVFNDETISMVVFKSTLFKIYFRIPKKCPRRCLPPHNTMIN